MRGSAYYDADADLSLVRSRRIGIIGYGNQGRAHALNLRDCRCEVRVGLQVQSPSRAEAEADGFEVETVPEVAAWADLTSLLVPDQAQKAIFEADIRARLAPGDLLMVAHGFSIEYGLVVPPPDVDVALVDAWDHGAGFDRFPGVGVVRAIRRHPDNSAVTIIVVTGHVVNNFLRPR